MAAVGALSSEAASAPEPRKLRVGLAVASRMQPRWVLDAFAAVARSDFAGIALIAETREASREEPLLWSLYDRADRFAFARGADPCAPADLLSGVAHERFLQLAPGAPPRLPCALDVLFALDGVEEGPLEGLARYGVWRFRFGADGRCPARLVGFREVAAERSLTASGLSVRVNGERRVVYQSWSRTYPLSPARTRAQVLEKTAQFPVRALRELHRDGPAWLQRGGQGPKGNARGKRSDAEGANGDLTPVSAAQSIARIGARIARRGVEKALNVEQWFLAYRMGPGPGGDPRAIPPGLEGFHRLMPPPDRYWADPFVLERNGRYFVFFEELPFRAGKAHIAMVEIGADGAATPPVKVLERDYHLSYPFILEHDGQLYMIPETARRGTVELYRCIDFPLRWRLERVLMEGVRCVDATFHRDGERWWMFANVAAGASRMFDDELHLFHARDLTGEWTPHPANPVRSDARCARPAGRLYRKAGALYRPAQVCVPLYGAGLAIHRVLRLTPTEYLERQVSRVLPSRAAGLLGVHTVNRAGDLTVIDAFTRTSRF